MKIEKIRQMNDEELKRYIDNISGRKKDICIKCGKSETNYAIYIQNRNKIQQRKLCNICEKCYEGLIEYLETEDVNWD